jgi:hypothetical protein
MDITGRQLYAGMTCNMNMIRRRTMPLERKKVLAIDLDGTLLQYDGWKGDAHYGKPNPGMREMLQEVRDAGWLIVIWTTRSGDGAIRNHLTKHNIPFDYVNKNPGGPGSSSPKIFADVYLDDRAIRFDGSTEGLAERILNAVPWFEETEEEDGDQ